MEPEVNVAGEPEGFTENQEALDSALDAATGPAPEAIAPEPEVVTPPAKEETAPAVKTEAPSVEKAETSEEGEGEEEGEAEESENVTLSREELNGLLAQLEAQAGGDTPKDLAPPVETPAPPVVPTPVPIQMPTLEPLTDDEYVEIQSDPKKYHEREQKVIAATVQQVLQSIPQLVMQQTAVSVESYRQSADFFDKNPEFKPYPNLVLKTSLEIRREHPEYNQQQILDAAKGKMKYLVGVKAAVDAAKSKGTVKVADARPSLAPRTGGAARTPRGETKQTLSDTQVALAEISSELSAPFGSR